MRCPKCGRISFDHLETCRKCNSDLRTIAADLGGFIRPNPQLCWFETRDVSSAVAPVDLSDIDVSDLMPGQDGDTLKEVVREIDPGELEAVAKDEEFQHALDDVLKDV